MSSVEEFNFEAPQFVEPLSNVEDCDDGADKFFDAEGNEAANDKSPRRSVTTKNSVEVDMQNLGRKSEEVQNDENLEPSSTKTNGRESRFHYNTRLSVKKGSPLKKNQYVSLAEQIHKFHHGTPPRFKRKSGVFKSRVSKAMPTIAHSPRLQTKIRSRQSTISTMSLDERPAVVRPLKRTQPKDPPKPAPKPTTVPKPFNLTGTFKKVQDQTSKDKSSTSSKTPQKPVNIKKKKYENVDGKIVVKEEWAITGLTTTNRLNKVTKIVPFSFEQRDKDKLKAKQMKLQEANEVTTSDKPNSGKPGSRV